jgi:hypothetical protein
LFIADGLKAGSHESSLVVVEIASKRPGAIPCLSAMTVPGQSEPIRQQTRHKPALQSPDEGIFATGCVVLSGSEQSSIAKTSGAQEQTFPNETTVLKHDRNGFFNMARKLQ